MVPGLAHEARDGVGNARNDLGRERIHGRVVDQQQANAVLVAEADWRIHVAAPWLLASSICRV